MSSQFTPGITLAPIVATLGLNRLRSTILVTAGFTYGRPATASRGRHSATILNQRKSNTRQTGPVIACGKAVPISVFEKHLLFQTKGYREPARLWAQASRGCYARIKISAGMLFSRARLVACGMVGLCSIIAICHLIKNESDSHC
jgi:hypothetical protein